MLNSVNLKNSTHFYIIIFWMVNILFYKINVILINKQIIFNIISIILSTYLILNSYFDVLLQLSYSGYESGMSNILQNLNHLYSLLISESYLELMDPKNIGINWKKMQHIGLLVANLLILFLNFIQETPWIYC